MRIETTLSISSLDVLSVLLVRNQRKKGLHGTDDLKHVDNPH